MLSAIAQFVRNRYLRAARPGGGRPTAARIWLRSERVLAKIGDPLVRHHLGRFAIRLPLSHALPRIHQSYPQYSMNLGRIGAAVARKYPDLRAIDVGANVGDSVAIMRERATYPILCVEAEQRFFDVLRDNARGQFPDVELVLGYLGEADVDLAGRLDASHGTANLTAAGGEHVSVRTLTTLLERHPAFAAAKLLKVDTDGYDNKIIRGAAAGFLGRARPVVFFEYDPHFLALQNDDGLSIFPILRGLGYRDLLVYENFGSLAGTLDLADEAGLAEMHRQNSGHGGFRYADLCAFHADDADLFDELRQSEGAVAAAAVTTAAGAGR